MKSLSLDANGAAMKLRAAIEKNDKVSPPTGMVDAACFNTPLDTGKETACRQQRNAALATLLVASDDLCQEHLKSIYGNDAYYNILTGSVATFFSGAAAIAGSGSAKSALAAISTFSNAERSLINETIYKNMLVTATTKKIREIRDTKAAALLPGGFKKSVDEYPMLLAVRDVVEYHYSCSFMLGLERALEEGTQPGADGKKAKFELEKRSLEMYIASQSTALRARQPGITPDQVDADKGIAGATARIEAIEAQLLALVKSQAPADVSAEKPAAKPAAAKPATEPTEAEKSAAALKAATDRVALAKAQAEAAKAEAEAAKAQAEAARAWAEVEKAKQPALPPASPGKGQAKPAGPAAAAPKN